jgi:hypothetical protein
VSGTRRPAHRPRSHSIGPGTAPASRSGPIDHLMSCSTRSQRLPHSLVRRRARRDFVLQTNSDDHHGRGYADTVIRSRSGAQAVGLENEIVLAPAVRFTVILQGPGVLKLPVLVKWMSVGLPPSTLM